MFVGIDFPEYQREPDIWSRQQKQRLIDSILRQFDISSVYFYVKDNGVLECIDGRQRLNAIMSFLNDNPSDERDNGFPLMIENEISSGLATEYDALCGRTFAQLEALASDETSDLHVIARDACATVRNYTITTVHLSNASDVQEFNLQFLRLNLGALINAGEKLHAMIGGMRDLIFENERVGKHPFFESVNIPTRRYAKELTAAQVLLQIFTYSKSKDFARARHVDLQLFVKQHEEVDPSSTDIVDIVAVLDALREGLGSSDDFLKNRAITVSLILLAWENFSDATMKDKFWDFVRTFMAKLNAQVAQMKAFKIDERYAYLADFQRHITQASVEKPAVRARHEVLTANLNNWVAKGALMTDSEYRARGTRTGT